MKTIAFTTDEMSKINTSAITPEQRQAIYAILDGGNMGQTMGEIYREKVVIPCGFTALEQVVPYFQSLPIWPEKVLKSGEVSKVGLNSAVKISGFSASVAKFYKWFQADLARVAREEKSEINKGKTEEEKAAEKAAKLQEKEAEAEKAFQEELTKRGLKIENPANLIDTIEKAVACLVSFAGTPENAIAAIQKEYNLSASVDMGNVIDITPNKNKRNTAGKGKELAKVVNA